MHRALELASRGLGRTSPNPAVGAVVARGGVVVGEGWHRRAGEPHAERIALGNAGEAAVGAEIYVTLEPCCHHGRTPPCTDAIIEAGIRRVVYAMPDPDPRCAGAGAATLRAAGVEVVDGLLRDEAERLLEPYVKHRRTGVPLVTLKLGMSLDGKIATRSGHSRWITGEDSRRLVHEMRNRADAVMVGVGTVLADDPALTTRGVPDGRDALRVVADSSARTPPAAAVVSGGSDAGCLVACTEAAPQERVDALVAAGAEVIRLPEREGRVALPALMAELGRRGTLSVLLEGGAGLAWGALAARVVDRVALFYAPIVIGGESAVPAVGGFGAERVEDAFGLSDLSVRHVGRDLLVEGRVSPANEEPCSPD